MKKFIVKIGVIGSLLGMPHEQLFASDGEGSSDLEMYETYFRLVTPKDNSLKLCEVPQVKTKKTVVDENPLGQERMDGNTLGIKKLSKND